jgi:lysophospholipase
MTHSPLFSPRLTVRCLAALAVMASLVLGGCAAVNPSPVTPTQATFAELDVATQVPGGVWTAEADAARTGWAGWHTRISQMADVQVGSSAGVPVGGAQGIPVTLHWRKYVHRHESRGGVVVSVGFTEGLTMYQEVIHDLVANGYSVYIQDHRGQGFSSRLTGGTVGHVNRFDYLIADLAAFTTNVATERGPAAKPLYGVAHSMGGAVLAGVLERQGDATPLAAVALFTPMFEPATVPPGSNWLGRALQGWCHRGASAVQLPAAIGTRQAAGQGFDAEKEAFMQAANPLQNDMSHSVPRLMQRWQAREATCEAGLHCGHADARVAGPTLQWAMQACHASADIRGAAARHIARPVLLFSGGQDTIVVNPAQVAFCQEVNAARPGLCSGWLLPRSRHALLVETDDLRSVSLGYMLRFFDAHARQSGGAVGP